METIKISTIGQNAENNLLWGTQPLMVHQYQSPYTPGSGDIGDEGMGRLLRSEEICHDIEPPQNDRDSSSTIPQQIWSSK